MLAAVAVLAEAASGQAASPLPGVAVAISAIHLAAVGIRVFAIVASTFSANVMEPQDR